MSEDTVTLHQCSLSLQCKSRTCTHVVPHVPHHECEISAPCGCWPGDNSFRPHVQCIHVDRVVAPEDCPDCGKIEAKGHHHGDCIAALRAKNAELLAALVEAREYIDDLAKYEGAYFRDNHDVGDELAKIDAVIERSGK